MYLQCVTASSHIPIVWGFSGYVYHALFCSQPRHAIWRCWIKQNGGHSILASLQAIVCLGLAAAQLARLIILDEHSLTPLSATTTTLTLTAALPTTLLVTLVSHKSVEQEQHCYVSTTVRLKRAVFVFDRHDP